MKNGSKTRARVGSSIPSPVSATESRTNSPGAPSTKRRASASPSATAAVLVRINLELGLAPEQMRATLESDKGRAMLEGGLSRLGKHLVSEVLR